MEKCDGLNNFIVTALDVRVKINSYGNRNRNPCIFISVWRGLKMNIQNSRVLQFYFFLLLCVNGLFTFKTWDIGLHQVTSLLTIAENAGNVFHQRKTLTVGILTSEEKSCTIAKRKKYLTLMVRGF